MSDPREPEQDPASEPEDESRRSFIKKLPYLAPVVQTFLLSETAFGSDRRGGDSGNDGGDDGGDDDGHDGHDDGHGGRDDDSRRRRQVSPHTRGRSRGRG